MWVREIVHPFCPKWCWTESRRRSSVELSNLYTSTRISSTITSPDEMVKWTVCNTGAIVDRWCIGCVIWGKASIWIWPNINAHTGRLVCRVTGKQLSSPLANAATLLSGLTVKEQTSVMARPGSNKAKQEQERADFFMTLWICFFDQAE